MLCYELKTFMQLLFPVNIISWFLLYLMIFSFTQALEFLSQTAIQKFFVQNTLWFAKRFT